MLTKWRISKWKQNKTVWKKECESKRSKKGLPWFFNASLLLYLRKTETICLSQMKISIPSIEKQQVEETPDIVADNPHPHRPNWPLLLWDGHSDCCDAYLNKQSHKLRSHPRARIERVGPEIGPRTVLVVKHSPQEGEPPCSWHPHGQPYQEWRRGSNRPVSDACHRSISHCRARRNTHGVWWKKVPGIHFVVVNLLDQYQAPSFLQLTN